jgi:hypothetical protein
MIFDMTGEQYVRDWALPQVAFHQMNCIRHSPAMNVRFPPKADIPTGA